MRKKIYIILFLFAFILLFCGCNKNSELANSNVSETVAPEDFAYTMLVTINPELKLYIDSDNKILFVEYLNDDAKNAFIDSQLVGNILDDGLAQIVSSSIDKDYLKDDKDVTVTLAEVNIDSVKKDEVLSSAEGTIKNVLTEKSINANVIIKIQLDDNKSAVLASEVSQSILSA